MKKTSGFQGFLNAGIVEKGLCTWFNGDCFPRVCSEPDTFTSCILWCSQQTEEEEDTSFSLSLSFLSNLLV